MTEIEITRRRAIAGAAGIGILGLTASDDDEVTGGVTVPESSPRADTIRPAIGGTWITAEDSDGSGTLGITGEYDGETVALSNRHVVDSGSDDDPEDVTGTTVYQPSEESDPLGSVVEASDIGGMGSEDWALIGCDDGTGRTLAVENIDEPGTVETGDRIIITGARTGIIGGWITRTSVDTNFRGELYSGLIEYQVDENRATGGNSGGLVGTVTDGTLTPVGVHTFAVDEWRYAIPWDSVPAGFTIGTADGEPPHPDAGGRVEATVTDWFGETVTVYVANVGGESVETVVELVDDGTTLDSETVILDAIENTAISFNTDRETVELRAGTTEITTTKP